MQPFACAHAAFGELLNGLQTMIGAVHDEVHKSSRQTPHSRWVRVDHIVRSGEGQGKGCGWGAAKHPPTTQGAKYDAKYGFVVAKSQAFQKSIKVL